MSKTLLLIYGQAMTWSIFCCGSPRTLLLRFDSTAWVSVLVIVCERGYRRPAGAVPHAQTTSVAQLHLPPTGSKAR